MLIIGNSSSLIKPIKMFTWLKYFKTKVFTNVNVKMFTFVNQIIGYEFRRVI